HTSSTLAWPVRWESATTRGTERAADEFAHGPLLAAHRVLDRLAAMAFDAVDGVVGADAAFVDAISEVRRAIPDLARVPSGNAMRTRSASLHTTIAVDDAEADTFAADASNPDGLVDVDGVAAVEEIARRLAGRLGAHAVRWLADVAAIAEQRLPGTE